MKTLIKIFTLSFLLLSSKTAFSQSVRHNETEAGGYDELLRVMPSMIDFFQNWIDKCERLAKRQDREKFAEISNNINRNVNDLRNLKSSLIAKLEDTTIVVDYGKELRILVSQHKKIVESIANSQPLAGKIGSDAAAFSRSIEVSLNEKKIILEQAMASSRDVRANRRYRANIVTLLSKGKKELKQVEDKLKELTDKLEGDNR
jgi:hypothetical protein